MVSLLKTFGKGILYVVGLPFFLVALVLFGAVGLVAFVVQLVMSIFYFFSGRKFFPDLPEDLELRALREGPRASDNEEREEEPITQEYAGSYTMPQQEQPKFVYPFFEEAPKQEEPILQETPVTESESEPEQPVEEEEEEEEAKPDPVLFNDDSSMEETIETANEEEEEEEELETYVPRSSSFSVDDDTEEESGVDIKYDL